MFIRVHERRSRSRTIDCGETIVYRAVVLAAALAHSIGYCCEPEKPVAERSKVLTEVADLFQRSKKPADPDEIERLLRKCVDAHDYEESYDNQASEFYEAVSLFCKYVDEHRLDRDVLETVRVSATGSRDLHHDSTERGVAPAEHSLDSRIAMLNSSMWAMVRNGVGECQPRHVVLTSVLTTWNMFMPVMRSCVFMLDEELKKGDHKKGNLNELEKFFMEDAHRALRLAVQEEHQAILQAYSGATYFKIGEHAQKCLEQKSDSVGFTQNLREFCKHFKTVFERVPNYAIEERYDLAQFLRAVWNMVHAHGNRKDREDLHVFVTGLRDHFAELSDAVTVKWLDQVMAKPGAPPEVLVETATLVPTKPPTK